MPGLLTDNISSGCVSEKSTSEEQEICCASAKEIKFSAGFVLSSIISG